MSRPDGPAAAGPVDLLVDRLGGARVLAAVVEDFSARLLADRELSPFFAGLDLVTQRRHLELFLAAALAVPAGTARSAAGPDRQLVRAHAGRGIRDDHFDAAAGHLLDALQARGVAPALLDDVLPCIAAVRADVVC